MSTERKTVSLQEAAKILGIGRATAYKAAADGSIPTIKIGGRLLVPVARLERMLAGEAA